VTTSIRRTTPLAEPGVRFGLANALLVAALLAATAARLDVSETEFVAVVVAGLASIGLSFVLTAWIGVVAWALFTGFVENDFGTLTFAEPDLVRLGVFAACTVGLAVLCHRTWAVAKEDAHE
jgi:hypothetical protein